MVNKKQLKSIQKNWKDQILVFALQNTKTRQYMSIDDFREEIDRIKTIRKALEKYDAGVEVDFPRLVTNFVILNNIFTPYVINQMLFAEVPDSCWKYLKTILSWLGLLIPDKILKLPTTPQVNVRLNSLNIHKKLLKELNNVVSEKYNR